MKILVLINEPIYPVINGQRNRSACIIESLASFNEIDLITIHGKTEQNKIFNSQINYNGKFNSNFKTLSIALKNKLSLYESKFYHKSIHNKIKKHINSSNYDIILYEGLPTARYFCKNESKTWLDEHNIEWKLYEYYKTIEKKFLKKLLLSIEVKRLKGFELDFWEKSDIITCCSEKESETIPNSSVIPNTSYFQKEQKTPLYKDRNLEIIFTGSMGWLPNVNGALWFYSNVWPILKKELPNLNWTIAGKDPSQPILDLAKDQQINVTGAVDSMFDYTSRARVSIVSLFMGSGTRIKILEASNWSTPSVSTALGTEGLSFINGQEIIIEDEPQKMAEHINKLLVNEDYWNKISHSSKQKFNDLYSKGSITKKCEEILLKSVSNF